MAYDVLYSSLDMRKRKGGEFLNANIYLKTKPQAVKMVH
jgi:hypothetical protein